MVFAQERALAVIMNLKKLLHKRGDRTEWSQRGERSIQNRRSMQNIQRNRSNDSDLPRLEKYMELENELIAKNLKLSNEQIAVLDTLQQDALVEKYTRARLEIEKKVKQKREDMNLRRSLCEKFTKRTQMQDLQKKCETPGKRR